jgi:hypothetical protein
MTFYAARSCHNRGIFTKIVGIGNEEKSGDCSKARTGDAGENLRTLFLEQLFFLK